MSHNLFVQKKTSVEQPSMLACNATSVDYNDSVIESKVLATFTEEGCSDDEVNRSFSDDDLLDTAECSDMFTTDAFHANVHRRHGVSRREMYTAYSNYWNDLKQNSAGNGKGAVSFLKRKSKFPNRNEPLEGEGIIAQIKNGSISMKDLKEHYAGFKNLLHVIKTKMKHYTRVSKKVKADIRNDIQFAVNFVDRNGKSRKSRHNGSKASKRGSVVGREFAKAQQQAKKEETKMQNEAKMEENKRYKDGIFSCGRQVVEMILQRHPTALDDMGVTLLQVNLVCGLIIERCFKIHTSFRLQPADIAYDDVMNVVCDHLMHRWYVIFAYTKQLASGKKDCCGRYGFDGVHNTAAERKVEKEAMDNCLIRAAVSSAKRHIEAKIAKKKAEHAAQDAKMEERAQSRRLRRAEELQRIEETEGRLNDLKDKTEAEQEASKNDLLGKYADGTIPVPPANMCPPGSCPPPGGGGAGNGGNGDSNMGGAGNGADASGGLSLVMVPERSPSPSYSDHRGSPSLGPHDAAGAASARPTPRIGNGHVSGNKENASRMTGKEENRQRSIDRRRTTVAGDSEAGRVINETLLVNADSY